MTPQGRGILLVEDDEHDIFFMERAMVKANLDPPIHVATNGQDAIDYLRGVGKYPDRATYPLPGCIFLDLKLPDGPADDVYEAAKESDPEMPIVVITGYPDSEMLDRILAKGPVTVLKKPLQVEQLQQTVRILGHKDAAKLAA